MPNGSQTTQTRTTQNKTTQKKSTRRDILDRPGNLIVVGIDDTPGSREAARWAAAEAARRRASLRLVSAFAVPTSLAEYDTAGVETASWLRDGLVELQQDIIDELHTQHPQLSISGVVAQENPIALLRYESGPRLGTSGVPAFSNELHRGSAGPTEHAAMLVVATRDSGRALHVVLGSVAMGAASTCPGPVVVIRPGTEGANPDGPVVVGVDGSPTSEQAVAFAFEAAAVRGAALLAVHSWNDNVAFDVAGTAEVGPRVNVADLEEYERVLLSERLAGWRDKYPDVVVQQSVMRGRPTENLLRLSANAQLMVVGSRGRSGFVGALLGSTSQALITHSQCPVVVVKPV